MYMQVYLTKYLPDNLHDTSVAVEECTLGSRLVANVVPWTHSVDDMPTANRHTQTKHIIIIDKSSPLS